MFVATAKGWYMRRQCGFHKIPEIGTWMKNDAKHYYLVIWNQKKYTFFNSASS